MQGNFISTDSVKSNIYENFPGGFHDGFVAEEGMQKLTFQAWGCIGFWLLLIWGYEVCHVLSVVLCQIYDRVQLQPCHKHQFHEAQNDVSPQVITSACSCVANYFFGRKLRQLLMLIINTNSVVKDSCVKLVEAIAVLSHQPQKDTICMLKSSLLHVSL